MANVPFITNTFGTASGILMFPDNYQARPQTFQPTDSTAVTVGAKKVVKAGTIWPSNDTNAQGVVLYDVDVTNGTASGALLFEGSIKTSKLPAAPDAAAIAALPRITFFGAITAVVASTVTGLTAPVKAATPVALAAISLSNGLVKQSLTWDPADAAFGAATVYKAIIVVTAPTGKVIGSTLEVTIAGASTVDEVVAADGSSATITATFPATAA